MITENAATDGLSIAMSLGWPQAETRQRRIMNNNTELDIARTSISGQPAVTFARVINSNGVDPLYSAALYGYHASTDWGLLADNNGVAIFNSKRLVNNNWFQFPKISWDSLGEGEEIIQALTPHGIVSEEIEKLAVQLQEPTRILKPIDDRLVERLDSWRDQALRYTRDTRGIDEKLQTLYAQLFVLRAVEDRGLDPEIPILEDVLRGADDINRSAWSRLYKSAKERIGSELFATNHARDIPSHVLAGVIRDLYQPTNLPGEDTRYDFSWIDSDVLGSAYEKYLSTILMAGPKPSQLEIFSTPEHDVERFSVRKMSGTYYTPRFLHDYLSKKCIDQFFDNNEAGEIPRTIDFACGSGSFLVAAVDQMLHRLNSQDGGTLWAKRIIQGGFIAGIDIDPKAVMISRLRLWHRLVEEPDALPLPYLSEVVVVADGLDRSTWGQLNGEYDIVLGNPPFLKTSMIDSKEELASRFKSAVGRYDFSHLFLEQALAILKSTGYYGLVVPNRVLKNKTAQIIRKIIISKSSLLSIVDFGSNKPFKDVGAYVACLVGKMREQEEVPKYLTLTEVESLEPNYLSALIIDAERTGRSVPGEIKTYQARHPTNEVWSLLSDSDEQLRISLEEESVRLDSVVGIFQGIKTGANDVFMFELVSSDSTHLSSVINGFGDSSVIETELLRPVVYGAEVRRNEIVSPSKMLLYTYTDGKRISEQDLEAKYPYTWRYLSEYRDMLSTRASAKRGGKWYELSWARSEEWLSAPKVMMRDLALRPSFGIDIYGQTCLVGGTAIVPPDPENLFPLLAYLNSTIIERIVKKTTPQFGGKFRKYEPQHLHGLPVFTKIFQDDEVRESLTENVHAMLSGIADENPDMVDSAEEKIDNIIIETIRSVGVEI